MVIESAQRLSAGKALEKLYRSVHMHDRDLDHASADYDLVVRCVEVVMGLDNACGTLAVLGQAGAAKFDDLIPLEGWTAALRHSIRSGELPMTLDSEVVAAMILAVVEGAENQWLLAPATVLPEAIMELVAA